MGSVEIVGDDVWSLCDGLDLLDARGLECRLQDLERLARWVEHAIVAVVRESDRRGVWAADGHRSVQGWCKAVANWSAADARHRVRTVELCDDIAECDAALAGGTLGVAQVRELARASANPRCGDQLGDVAEVMIANAATLPYESFRRLVARWETLADVDGAHRDHENAEEHRALTASVVGSTWQLEAHGGIAKGASMKEILDRFVEAEFRVDCDEARARLGDAATASDLARTPAQRRFDALHAIFFAAASTPPDARPPEPIVDIVIDEATFEAALTALAEQRPLSDCMPAVTDPTTRRCETIHGDSIDPLDAVTAAIIGRVRRVVVGSKGCVIDLGMSSRLFRGSSRLAVWLQGKRCIWPGCGLRHCQIDHTRSWTDHGATNTDNGSPLCGHHNRWKTRGYKVTRDAHGHWHTYRPDGTEIATI